VVVEDEPEIELIVGLITMVIKNRSITYNDVFGNKDTFT
jgi:hypothetical protein